MFCDLLLSRLALLKRFGLHGKGENYITRGVCYVLGILSMDGGWVQFSVGWNTMSTMCQEEGGVDLL